MGTLLKPDDFMVRILRAKEAETKLLQQVQAVLDTLRLRAEELEAMGGGRLPRYRWAVRPVRGCCGARSGT